jgi:hypothetical protein
MLKKIKKWGILLIGIGLTGIYFFGSIYFKRGLSPLGSGFDIFQFIFALILPVFYLITGIGLLRNAKWGYYMFKALLYSLILAFPIGTIISYQLLPYIKKNEIKKYFVSKFI